MSSEGVDLLPPDPVEFSQFTPHLMTASTWNPDTLTTLTLPDGTWGSIRTAVLCFAVDERLKGNVADADHWLEAFHALKEAMGD